MKNDINEIYVLKRRPADFFGDGPSQWELTGWTDDPRVAGQWRNGATMHENRGFDCIKKMTPNKECGPEANQALVQQSKKPSRP